MVKYNDVRFCFLDIIETNTMVQLDFDFDARFGNYDFFKTCVHAHVSIIFLPSHMHAYIHYDVLPKENRPIKSFSRKLAVFFFSPAS